MDFPSRLKRKRIEKKMTQEQLGTKVNVTKVSISGYESGNRTPDMETLQLIADALDVSTDYLLGRTDDPSPTKNKDDEFEEFINDPETNIFFKDYLSAPEERKQELRRFWEFLKQQEKDRKPGDKQGDS